MSELNLETMQAMAKATRLEICEREDRWSTGITYEIRDDSRNGAGNIFESSDLEHIRAFMLGWIARGSR